MVQKVLEGLTKFNSLSKALLDLRDGKDGALFRKNWCLFFHGFCVYKIESTIAVYSDVCFGFALKKKRFWLYVDVGRDANHKNPSSQHHLGTRPSSTSSWCASKGVCTRPTNLNSINWTPVGGTFRLHIFLRGGWFGVCSEVWVVCGGVCEPVPFRFMMYLGIL